MPKYAGVPYTTSTSFEITPRATINSSRPVIAMQIMSRSNLLTGFNLISSPKMLYENFSDKIPHITLEKAINLINSGYNLYLNNVYTSSAPINLRIINNEDRSEIVAIPYDPKITESSELFVLENYTDSVIKLDLSKVQPKDYFIIEINNESVGVQTNMLIWFHDKTDQEINEFEDEYGNVGESAFIKNYLNISIDQIYYSTGTGISLLEGNPFINVKSIIDKSPLGFLSFCEGLTSKIVLVHNKGFLNIGNHSENITITMDESYISNVISRTKINQRVIDIFTRYNTDNEEVCLKITKVDDFIYKVIVCKMYNDKVLYSDTYLGSTSQDVAFRENLKTIDILLNENNYIQCEVFQDNYVLPEGTFWLKKLNNQNDELFQKAINTEEVDLFVNGLKLLNPDSDLKYNFYYDSNFNSLRYQMVLYNLLVDFDVFGYFTYRGMDITDSPKKLAYFSDQELYINGNHFHTCDACLSMLAENNLTDAVIDNAVNCSNTLFKLDFVNYINVDSVLTRKDLRGYDDAGLLKDLRYCMIKPIFMKELGGAWDFTVSSVMKSILNTKKLFQQVFGVSIYLVLKSNKIINGGEGVEVEVDYKVPDVIDFESIKLLLKIG